MHIDEGFEAIFLAAVKKPVDWAFLVGFAVVFVEIFDEIITDDVFWLIFATQSIGNEFEVVLQCFFAVDHLDKCHKTSNDVVVKVFVVADWDDVVLIRRISDIFATVPLAASIGKPVHIQRIAAEHATYGVRDEAFDHILFGECVFAATHAVGNIWAIVKDAVDSHVFVFHLWHQLILQAVDIDEDAIELFLVGFKLLKAFAALTLPEQETKFQRTTNLRMDAVIIGYLCSNRSCIPELTRPANKGMLLEVPWGFKGVPILSW